MSLLKQYTHTCLALTCLFIAILLPTDNSLAHPLTGAFNIDGEADKNAFTLRIETQSDIVKRLVKLESSKKHSLSKLEYEKAKKLIGDFFKSANPIKIDGQIIIPEVNNVLFVKINRDLDPIKDKQPKEPDGAVWTGQTKCMVGLTYHYPKQSIPKPKTISLTWKTFDDGGPIRKDGPPIYQSLSATLYGFGDAEFAYFTPDEPEYIWHIPLAERTVQPVSMANAPSQAKTLPGLTLGLSLLLLIVLLLTLQKKLQAKPAIALNTALLLGMLVAIYKEPFPIIIDFYIPPSEEQATETFTTIHNNIYKAFIYKTESDIYDALSHSVDGPLLDKLYNNIYSSLVLREEQGAICVVDEVKMLNTKILSIGDKNTKDFKIDANWKVYGVVRHWGHTHQRIHEYKAAYTIKKCPDNNWRVINTEIEEQKQVVEPRRK